MIPGFGGSGEEQKELRGGQDEFDDMDQDAAEDFLSDYRDEDAESDEIDEIAGRNLEIRIKKLVAHDNCIKQIDYKVAKCATVSIPPDEPRRQIDR
jgi:hypothetical protein